MEVVGLPLLIKTLEIPDSLEKALILLRALLFAMEIVRISSKKESKAINI
jgi:hypothetical protein